MLKGYHAIEGADFRDKHSNDYCKPPELLSATLDGTDIMHRFREIYGNERGWCSKLWRGYDLFGFCDEEKKLDAKWLSENGRVIYELVGQIGSYDVINLPSEIPEGSYWGNHSGKFSKG